MPKFNHVMLDLETLSTRTDAAIIQIAAIAFDIETGELGPRFNAYVREDATIGQAVGHVDLRTVGWWMQQRVAPAMGKAITDEDGAFSLAEALGAFAEWWEQGTDDVEQTCIEALWAHGSTFDIPILQTAFEVRCPEVYEGKVPWHYRAPRDTRTLYVAAGMGEGQRRAPDPDREHDAQYDCEYQIAQVCEAYAKLRGPSVSVTVDASEVAEQIADAHSALEEAGIRERALLAEVERWKEEFRVTEEARASFESSLNNMRAAKAGWKQRALDLGFAEVEDTGIDGRPHSL
jgi:hypothetical protein